MDNIDTTVTYILNQAPSNTDASVIKDLLIKFENDKGKVISYLWDPTIFDELPKKELTKIEYAREISMAFDAAREELEKEKRNK